MPKKGYKQTEEHKKKISEFRKGRCHSEESKRKMSESHKGHPTLEDTRLNEIFFTALRKISD